MRKTGIFSFKEIARNAENSKMLTDHLNEILSEVPFLILDREDIVRHEAHKCIGFLLK